MKLDLRAAKTTALICLCLGSPAVFAQSDDDAPMALTSVADKKTTLSSARTLHELRRIADDYLENASNEFVQAVLELEKISGPLLEIGPFRTSVPNNAAIHAKASAALDILKATKKYIEEFDKTVSTKQKIRIKSNRALFSGIKIYHESLRAGIVTLPLYWSLGPIGTLCGVAAYACTFLHPKTRNFLSVQVETDSTSITLQLWDLFFSKIEKKIGNVGLNVPSFWTGIKPEHLAVMASLENIVKNPAILQTRGCDLKTILLNAKKK